MKNLIKLGIVVLTVASLMGCVLDSDSDSSSDSNLNSSNTAALSGTAAVGAAIDGGTVEAKCADGSGFTSAVSTDTDGKWSGTVSADALPCALKVSKDGVELYSYVINSGNVNITTLTSIIIAQVTAQLPQDWYQGTQLNIDPAELQNAINNVITTLTTSGFSIPSGNPLTDAFVIGDDWDIVLDDIASSIAADVTLIDFDAYLQIIADGNEVQLSYVSSNPDGSGSEATGVWYLQVTGTQTTTLGSNPPSVVQLDETNGPWPASMVCYGTDNTDSLWHQPYPYSMDDATLIVNTDTSCVINFNTSSTSDFFGQTRVTETDATYTYSRE